MILSLRNIKVHYDGLEAVQGVSLDVSPGEIIALLGPNGSGKSTILKAVLGLKELTSGDIFYQEKRINGLAPHQLVGLGLTMIPEGRGLFQDMTVLENLSLGAYRRRGRKEIRADLEGVWELFPTLKTKRGAIAFSLSGGEQQMLAIGRALMAQPKLLLLDEPVQGLAPAVVEAIAEIITKINQRGVSMIVVEHNLSLAIGISHRLYILDQGRISFHGPSRELSEAEYARKVYLGG